MTERCARIGSAIAIGVRCLVTAVERAVGCVAGGVFSERLEDTASVSSKLSLLVVDVGDSSAQVCGLSLLMIGRQEGRSWRWKLRTWLGTGPSNDGDEADREDEYSTDGD